MFEQKQIFQIDSTFEEKQICNVRLVVCYLNFKQSCSTNRKRRVQPKYSITLNHGIMALITNLALVAVVAHQALATDAVPHVLAAAHFSRALRADLVSAGVNFPTVAAQIDVFDSHVPVELAASGRRDVSVDLRCGADDADGDDGDGDSDGVC